MLRSRSVVADVDLLLVIVDARTEARRAGLRFRTAVEEVVKRDLHIRVDVVILTASEEEQCSFATTERAALLWSPQADDHLPA